MKINGITDPQPRGNLPQVAASRFLPSAATCGKLPRELHPKRSRGNLRQLAATCRERHFAATCRARHFAATCGNLRQVAKPLPRQVAASCGKLPANSMDGRKKNFCFVLFFRSRRRPGKVKIRGSFLFFFLGRPATYDRGSFFRSGHVCSDLKKESGFDAVRGCPRPTGQGLPRTAKSWPGSILGDEDYLGQQNPGRGRPRLPLGVSF